MRVALATATATGRSAARPKGAVEGGCVRGAGVGGERCWMLECWGGQTWQRAAAGEHNAWAEAESGLGLGLALLRFENGPSRQHLLAPRPPSYNHSLLQPRPCPTD